jgi:hypothetical protein
MEKFKRIFRWELKYLPLIAVFLIIAGIAVYEIHRASFKELSREEFLNTAIKHKVTDFVASGKRWEMETPEGKYYHEFRSYDALESFKSSIGSEFGTLGYDNKIIFYEVGIASILVSLLVIFALNLIVLWFVVLYDLLKNEFTENHNKWIWLICMLLLPLITPFYYLFIAGAQKRKINYN